MAFDAMALSEHEAPAHGFEALAFAAELFALAADTAALFLLRRGHPDGAKALRLPARKRSRRLTSSAASVLSVLTPLPSESSFMGRMT